MIGITVRFFDSWKVVLPFSFPIQFLGSVKCRRVRVFCFSQVSLRGSGGLVDRVGRGARAELVA